MIVPFNSFGLWYEAIEIGGGWRVKVHNGGGIGTDTFFDSHLYTEAEAMQMAVINNVKIHMT
jgi:hypothetical protein